MCGRYENKIDPEEIYQFFSEQGITFLNRLPNVELKKIDIRPTNEIATIVKEKDAYALLKTKWGIPLKGMNKDLINSRIETVMEKPYWQKLFIQNRALLPMTGFYEWPMVDKKKVMSRIYLPDEEFFFVPALYQKNGEDLLTSLVTCPPNTFMEKVHHRMPVIIKKEEALKMMDAEIDIALKMCKPYKGKMEIVEFRKG